MPDTAVKMTLAELCRAVAEEMGVQVYEAEVEGLWFWQKNIGPGTDIALEMSVLYFATGDGMLRVIEWLEKKFEMIQVEWGSTIKLVHIYDAYTDKHGYMETWEASHQHAPTAVLLAFMKARKGVDVELLD